MYSDTGMIDGLGTVVKAPKGTELVAHPEMGVVLMHKPGGKDAQGRYVDYFTVVHATDLRQRAAEGWRPVVHEKGAGGLGDFDGWFKHITKGISHLVSKVTKPVVRIVSKVAPVIMTGGISLINKHLQKQMSSTISNVLTKPFLHPLQTITAPLVLGAEAFAAPIITAGGAIKKVVSGIGKKAAPGPPPAPGTQVWAPGQPLYQGQPLPPGYTEDPTTHAITGPGGQYDPSTGALIPPQTISLAPAPVAPIPPTPTPEGAPAAVPPPPVPQEASMYGGGGGGGGGGSVDQGAALTPEEQAQVSGGMTPEEQAALQAAQGPEGGTTLSADQQTALMQAAGMTPQQIGAILANGGLTQQEVGALQAETGGGGGVSGFGQTSAEIVAALKARADSLVARMYGVAKAGAMSPATWIVLALAAAGIGYYYFAKGATGGAAKSPATRRPAKRRR